GIAKLVVFADPTAACDGRFEMSAVFWYRFKIPEYARRELVWNLIGDFVSGGGSMLGSLQALFDNANLAPHGICLLWRPELVWLHVGSDALIAIAYFSIPFALALFVTKRSDVEFGWV